VDIFFEQVYYFEESYWLAATGIWQERLCHEVHLHNGIGTWNISRFGFCQTPIAGCSIFIGSNFLVGE